MTSEAPIAFIIYNRPALTELVFQAIRAARPRTLLVVADGPRHDRAGDPENCAAARAVIERVDWPCDVRKNYSSANLGCRERVASGLSWVFEEVEQAIILEDDCLPHPSFFGYCDELLTRYQHDERIMTISGSSLRPRRTNGSYYFTTIPHIWGWASWRRAWKLYDVQMASWPHLRQGAFLRNIGLPPTVADAWKKRFDVCHSGSFDTWDYQWLYAHWTQRALSISPSANLVSNIGFGPDATHTRETSEFARLPATEMQFPLLHAETLTVDLQADLALLTRDANVGAANRLRRLRRAARRRLHAALTELSSWTRLHRKPAAARATDVQPMAK